MLYIVPETTGEVHAFPTLTGAVKLKLNQILVNQDDLVVEMDDQSYELFRPVLRACNVEYKLVINVPEVATPRSFLFEDDPTVIISFDGLELKEKDTSMKQLKDIIGDDENESGEGETPRY